MKFSMTGQEKDDLLIQVTAWPGLTVFILMSKHQAKNVVFNVNLQS